MNKKPKIYPIFLPNAGCRTRCVFCNQYVMTGEKYPNVQELRMFENIKNVDEIAFYGGTFTGLPEEIMLELLSLYPRIPKRISTRPDLINEEIINSLAQSNVKVIELGIESLDNEVLDASNRGYTADTVIKAIESIKPNFELIAHLMIGLPKDNREKDIETTKKLINLGVKKYRIHPTLVFKDTKLEQMYVNGQYKPLNINEALDIVSDMVILIESNGGEVLRIGYHVPQSQVKFVVSGPYHQSFGDMVRAYIIKKIITLLGIKKVTYSKKFTPWFHSYGNDKLEIVEERLDSVEDYLAFDGCTYIDTLKKYISNTNFE